jgi:hypothetical protein
MALYPYRHEDTGATISALLPTIPEKLDIIVSFAAPSRRRAIMKQTHYKGDLLNDNVTLEDLLEQRTRAAVRLAKSAGLPCTFVTEVPTRIVTYDTTAGPERYNKIECIKMMRQVTGLGLREAKEMVEAYTVQKAVIKFTVHNSW